METIAKIDLIDLKEDSDSLLKKLMQAREVLSKMKKYQEWLFWAVISSFGVQILEVFLVHICHIETNICQTLLGVSGLCGTYLIFSLRNERKKVNAMYQLCNSTASKIAQNIERNQYLAKNYAIPKYVLNAIDLYEVDSEKKNVIFSAYNITIYISFVILLISIITRLSYGSALFYKETQNKHLKNQIDSLNRINQDLLKKLKNK